MEDRDVFDKEFSDEQRDRAVVISRESTLIYVREKHPTKYDMSQAGIILKMKLEGRDDEQYVLMTERDAESLRFALQVAISII